MSTPLGRRDQITRIYYGAAEKNKYAITNAFWFSSDIQNWIFSDTTEGRKRRKKRGRK